MAAAEAAAKPYYPDSLDSSGNSSDVPPPDAKLRLMCSYGGHIVPRPHDKSLCYVGGDTRLIVFDRRRHSTPLLLSDITRRLSETLPLLDGRPFTIKYQLPNEDLDSLISLSTDEDLENMIEEYDRISAAANKKNTTTTRKPSRLRLFLFALKPDSGSSIGSLSHIGNSIKSEDWLLDALSGLSESASVNSLLGLEDDGVLVAGNGGNSNKQGAQDVHSVPEISETTSSFGSTSSSPSLANLLPVRARTEEVQKEAAAGGIEERFSHMGFFPAVPSPAAVQTNTVAAAVEAVAPQSQPQQLPPRSQSKPNGGVDLASPASVSSDCSTAYPLSAQRAVIYQDPFVQNPLVNNRVPVYPVDKKLSDPSSKIQMQQVQDSGYALPTQLDQQQHQQMNLQQPQFIPPGAHYIRHHPSGAVPLAPYYPVYPPQQPPLRPQHLLDHQQYPLYYAYNVPVQKSNYSETAATQTPPLPSATISPSTAHNTAGNAPARTPDMGGGMYRTATGQVAYDQHQLQHIGFSQIHHPSQFVAPASAATGNYAYEFGNPAHAQMYFAQPRASQLAAQYRTMASAPVVVSSDASSQLPTDNIKQQIRTSQP